MTATVGTPRRSREDARRAAARKGDPQLSLGFDGPSDGPAAATHDAEPPAVPPAAARPPTRPAAHGEWNEVVAPEQPLLPNRETCEPGSNDWAWLDHRERFPLVLSHFIAEAMFRRDEIRQRRAAEGRAGVPERELTPRTIEAKAVWATLRDKLHRVRTEAGERYRLNNTFVPLYARLAMQEQPALKGWFRLRTRAGETPGAA